MFIFLLNSLKKINFNRGQVTLKEDYWVNIGSLAGKYVNTVTSDFFKINLIYIEIT